MSRTLALTLVPPVVVVLLACGGLGGGGGHRGGGGQAGGGGGTAGLANTMWDTITLTGGDKARILFRPDGTYWQSDDNNADPDTWKLEGDHLTMRHNDYVTIDATFIGGHTIAGTQKNDDGVTWEFRMTRRIAPAELACSFSGSGTYDLTWSQWSEFEDGSAKVHDTVWFYPNGRFVYETDPYNKNNPDPETWAQNGNDVSWDVNKFAHYKGTLIDDHTIIADVKNDDGKTWWVILLRNPAPDELLCGG